MSKQRISTRNLTVIAMFCAISYVAVVIGRFVPTVAGFLSYDPKDAVVAIAGFIQGPVACLAIAVIVGLVEFLTISATGPYGMIMNIVSTCAFTVPAAWMYKKDHSRKGAVKGLVLGVICVTICMVLWNYVVTPYYMGVPRDVVAGMLLSVFAPFNFVKGCINAGLTMLLYKPVVGSLRKAGLVAQSSGEHKTSKDPGVMIGAAALLITSVLLLLVMADII